VEFTKIKNLTEKQRGTPARCWTGEFFKKKKVFSSGNEKKARKSYATRDLHIGQGNGDQLKGGEKEVTGRRILDSRIDSVGE